MARSPEYPDLPWMPPRSWTDANRSSVQLIVIHVTDGAARASAAEDGAAYDQRRTDGTSTHYFHDCNTTIQCVRTADQAHAARAQGNRRGIQHELCTTADKADWSNAYHQAMLRVAARQAARDARKWDIPVRHLTVAQVVDGAKGFCGHVDITHAFPQDNGTHTDPGPRFPWSQFLDLVRAEIEEDDMPDANEIADAVVTKFRNTKEVFSDTEHAAMANDTAKAAAALLTPVLNQLLALARNEATEVPPTVEQIRAAVVDAVGGLPTPQEKATLLAAVLGPDAAAVGRILAGA